MKYPCSVPNHLLIVELLFFRFGNEEIRCVLTPFLSLGMLGVPDVECGFCVCLTNLFRFIIFIHVPFLSCTLTLFSLILILTSFWHSDLILPWLECLGVVVTSGSQSCGWWWGRRSCLLLYPILQLFLV